MPLAIGDKIGPYQILAVIGKGGMGEVYRAHDSRLNRDVAVKVSAAQFTERFAREARSIAALNHTNVCHLYDVGPDYLVMEYVEGHELRGPLSFEDALPIIQQLIDGIEAAHEKNIIHRDLKPANIKVTPEGVVKILDFGLAKAMEPPASSEARAEDSPTFTMGATVAGTILGTAGYMAPEQAKGKPADRRSDIWSFGVVVYEMLTGKKLFQGESAIEILGSILNRELDLSAAPARARKLLRWCLEKDRKHRLAAISDARRLLGEEVESTPVAQPRKWLWPSIAGVAAVGALIVSGLHFRETPPETPVVRATILPPENTTVDFTNGLGLPALSPDGKRMVFGARGSDGKNPLWVRSLDGLSAQPLAGTDGATFPFWSPDSRYIAFFADGKLKKIDAAGGPAIALAIAKGGRGGSWSSAGVIVFSPYTSEGLVRVSSAGGTATPLPGLIGRFPCFLPDSQHFLFQNAEAGLGMPVKVLVGSLDGSPAKLLLDTGSNAVYSQGNLLYLRDGTLMARPFDPRHLTTSGEEVPVAEGVRTILNSRTVGVFTISGTGLLLYSSGEGQAGRALTWFDRDGKAGMAIGPPANNRFFRFSPDRKSLAALTVEQGTEDIWTYDVERGVPSRLTSDPAQDRSPIWSPDGKSIVFNSNRKGNFDIYRRAASGAGTDELLYSDATGKWPTSWSPDGRFVLFFTGGTINPTRSDIWALPLTPEKPGGALKPIVILQTPFSETYGEFSPDGEWMAYQSDESGRNEIYVTQFPPPSSGQGGKRQISSSGGIMPRWRQDGKELFYIGADFRLMAAEVAIGAGAVEVGQVRTLFGPITARYYDVAADGQSFVIPYAPETKSAGTITLIQNWAAGLRK